MSVNAQNLHIALYVLSKFFVLCLSCFNDKFLILYFIL